MNTLFAVATKDGISINLHFGHADEFWIYEVDSQNVKLLEKRNVEKYCHGHTDVAGVLDKIKITIKDCTTVLVAKIGDNPAEKLAAVGITASAGYAYMGVEDSILEYSKNLLAV